MSDFTYLSLGGGVQSSTIAEMIVERELPPVDLVVFADTGDEPDYVYNQIDYLCGRLSGAGVPCEMVTAGSMIEHLYTSGRRFAALPVFTVTDGKAGRMRRQCTREYKIDPIEKRVKLELMKRGMARQTGRGIEISKGVTITPLLGISLDEVSRMKPNKHKRFTNQWPLIDRRMTRHDCKLWLQSRSLSIPHKSSCIICPFHNDSHWRWVKDTRPADWQHAVDFDDWLRNGTSKLTASARGRLYLHRQCVPLSEVDLSNQQDHGQLELWDVCDEGYCFV